MKHSDDILRWWGLLEADFQREYQIDLNASIGSMPWRRFLVLLAGLSPNSAFRAMVGEEENRPVVLEGGAAARHIREWLG